VKLKRREVQKLKRLELNAFRRKEGKALESEIKASGSAGKEPGNEKVRALGNE
jgi:hypothetical protein